MINQCYKSKRQHCQSKYACFHLASVWVCWEKETKDWKLKLKPKIEFAHPTVSPGAVGGKKELKSMHKSRLLNYINTTDSKIKPQGCFVDRCVILSEFVTDSGVEGSKISASPQMTDEIQASCSLLLHTYSTAFLSLPFYFLITARRHRPRQAE